MEEKRQEDVDTMIRETREKLEVSGAVNSQVRVLSTALPSGEITQLTAHQQHQAWRWHPGLRGA